MRRYTDEYAKRLLDSVNFPKRLKVSETFRVLWWCYFNKSKMEKFLSSIEKGMHLTAAYNSALNYKP